MLSVNSMLNQDHQHHHYLKEETKTLPTSSARPSVLTISHLLCDPSMKSPSLSPSSSPSPTDSFPFPFAQELNTPPLSTSSSPLSSSTSLHSMLSSTNSDFALHTRPFLPPTTSLLEDKKRRSPTFSISPSLSPPPSFSTVASSPSSHASSLSNDQQHHGKSLTNRNTESNSDEVDDLEDEEEEEDDDDDQSSTSSKPSPTRLKAKRRRANAKQLQILNQVFDRTFFPSTQMRAELGRQLGMSPRTVQIWFQNKRQAMRTRERQRLLRLKDESD